MAPLPFLRSVRRARLVLTCGVLLPLCTAHLLAPVALLAADSTPPPVAAPAPLPPRDVLRRMIEPFVNLFTKEPPGTARAFSLKMRLVEATNQPPELQGQRLVVFCQPPDKLLFQFPALGELATVSRQGQTLWATPGSRLAPLLERAQTMKVPADQQEPLAPLRLTVPTTLFWLLYRFTVKVRDAGDATHDGVACHRVEMDSPDKEEKGKYIRLWIRKDNFRPARLDWFSPTDHATVLFDEVRLVSSLPAETFQASEAAHADLLTVPVKSFRPFMTLLGKEEEKRQKARRTARGGQPLPGGATAAPTPR